MIVVCGCLHFYGKVEHRTELMFSPSTKAAWCLATFLSVFVTGEIPIHAEVEPEFLAPLENHTVTQGRDVHFTCVVNHLSNYRVAWIKSDSKAILAIHTNMVALNPRLSVTYNNHNTWKLHVSNVQANDSGTYMCQVNTDPMKSQMGHLAVVIPPDIVDTVSEGSSAREGGNVRLACSATGVPPPAVMWRREHNKPIVFRHDGGRERKVVEVHKGESLDMSHVQRSDMGAYYCIASNGVPPTVSRRYHVQVHFIPQVKVTNQLVGAPLGSDVALQCYIEASPKAMNSWYREDSLVSDKLLENPKFRVTETIVNEYSLWMNLTIKSLAPSDFGTYVCASVNALGKMESQVSLHRLELNGFPDEPLVSGAAWQRARNLPARAHPASSHAQYSLAQRLPPQLYALMLTALRYVTTF
ncbi:lachesin-like [Leguminivora glycinivorella]|uniref:lachesin-like n=1 Tax=Leguminivora glycinivorella TaxID=1035111 RepID=UPI00200C86A1|nr:lachesin-like [Leguminivora glycinivorella]